MNESKKQILISFKGWMLDFIEDYVLGSLAAQSSEQELAGCFVETWRHFKKFTHFYFFVTSAANNHYENTYKQYENEGRVNKLSHEDSVFPLPAIAAHNYHTLVYQKYHAELAKNILGLFAEERQNRTINREALRENLEIVYACGLG